jgi:hypothetical protein
MANEPKSTVEIKHGMRVTNLMGSQNLSAAARKTAGESKMQTTFASIWPSEKKVPVWPAEPVKR